VAIPTYGAVVADAVVEVLRRSTEEREPAIESGRGSRARNVFIVVHELTEEPGSVAGVLEPDGQSVIRITQVRVSGVVREDAVVVGVLAGEDSRSVGTAERGCGDGVGERGAIVDEVVERMRHEPRFERVLGLVVHQDQEKVRRPLRCRRTDLRVACDPRDDGGNAKHGDWTGGTTRVSATLHALTRGPTAIATQ
jgi:hypothetical protein